MTEETRERGAERTKGRGGKGEERWEEKDREERKRMGVPSVLIFQFKHYLQDRFVAYRFEFLPRDAMHPRYQPWPCVRPSVRPSATSRSSTKTAKRRITKTAPHDSPGTLVYWCQRSPRNSTGVTSYWGTKCRWNGSKSAIFDK